MQAIPVLTSKPKHVVYGPLAEMPVNPDVVLLFVRADQTLILSEASQQLEGGLPPAMGRPACAIIRPSCGEERRLAPSVVVPDGEAERQDAYVCSPAVCRKRFSNCSLGLPFLGLSGTRLILRSCSAVRSGLFLES